MIQYKRLCEGAELPTDNLDTAKALLNDLMKQMKERKMLQLVTISGVIILDYR